MIANTPNFELVGDWPKVEEIGGINVSISVKFPRDEEEVFEQGKPVIILGANGSGKTRLSSKIEEKNDKRFCSSKATDDDVLIHRITAQKSLRISDKIPLAD